MTLIIGIVLFFLLSVTLSEIVRIYSSQLSDSLNMLVSLGLITIAASYFWLFGFEIGILLYVLVLLLLLMNVKRINWRSWFLNFIFLVTSFTLLILPSVLRFRSDLGVSGFLISNDAVIHATYSKGCTANSSNSSKLYATRDFKCVYYYSDGSHSLLNLVSKPLHAEESQMIILLNYALLSFVCFFTLSVLLHLNIDKKVAILVSFFAPHLFLLFNFSAYGFLPQTLFVPIFLGSLFLMFYSKLSTRNTRFLLFIAILVSSSITVYGFVTFIPYIVALILLIIHNFPCRKPFFKHSLFVMLFTLILLGPNITPNISAVVFSLKSSEVFSEQLTSPGNLVGYLPLKILSGLSGRVDYRYDSLDPMATKLLEPASVIFLGLAILGIYFLVKFRQKTVLLMIVTISISTLLVQFITNSPYSVSKMLSLLAPLVYISSVYAIWQISKKNTLISVFFVLIYGSLMILGNFRVIKSISYISSDDLNDLGALSTLIPENASVYFATDNDWAIYYLDSENVYLDGIHYMRDVIPEGKQYDYYIYPNTSDFECTQVSETKNFKVCSNPISPKN